MKNNLKNNMAPLAKLIVYMAFLFLILSSSLLQAQQLTQTVRGKIMDVDSRAPLPGANVVVPGSDPLLGASTDVNGEFRIEDVPIGRISLMISYIGYEERALSNILVTSGKEVVLEIKMRESLINMDEVVVTAAKDKAKVTNEMALVSARGFTVEETKRYAGSFNDPARMVSGYAGVGVDASGENSIIVRGNSPKGIQWRLEGIEIPNPNHFSEEGATGGAINALNSKMLADSEFYTGAFAPGYGNALSGVFDMKLRKGNNEQKEYSFSLGVLGIEAAVEGPFKKGSGASYLLNYRYSSLALLDDAGLVDFGGVPKYQDLSFKIFVPTKHFGTFSFFGLGGISNITEEAFADDDDELLSTGDYQAKMGVTGITQYLSFNANTYLQNSISISQNGSGYLGYEPDNQKNLRQQEDLQLNKNTIKAASTLHHKFNARHNLQAGMGYTHHYFNFYYRAMDEVTSEFVTRQNINGDAGHYHGFVSWKYRPLPELSFVSGFHAHGTTLNNDFSIEPRVGFHWQFRPHQAFTAGFGIHGKMEALPDYYSIITAEDGTTSMPNKNLGFSKARHYVLGYENRLSANLFLKAEAYYQQLFNIPVEDRPNSSYSLVNQTEGFTDRSLVNEGTGENVGMELTLERYFANNYYFLITASLFDSKYKAMDGIKRDTRFNGNYIGNLLFGKEFALNSKNKKVIGINTKISLLGARRYTPIDLGASMSKGETVWLEDRAFSRRGDDVFIANFAITYRVDHKRISQELKLDIQNVTNNTAELRKYYNNSTGEIEIVHQLALLPMVMYTINF